MEVLDGIHTAVLDLNGGYDQCGLGIVLERKALAS